jgi:CheY-like chemotaxis protein
VFANLLNNAAKYTPAEGRIWFSASCADGIVAISVRDSGEGITPDFLPFIFDLFTQANQSIDRSQGGLGVGLTLVKQLVELHAGSVEVKSLGHGYGSEFIVNLPEHISADNAIDDGSVTAANATAAAGAARILVVDDLAAAADSMRILLEYKNYRVETAYDGLTALQIAKVFKPDVILLDIGLPGIDGFEVARQLRAIPQLGNVLLVALTGYGQDKDRQLTIEAGFDAHLVKPADIDKLCTLIVDHCAKSPTL